MNDFKRIFFSFPEYYLVALVLFAGYTPPYALNPIVTGLALIIILQVIFKNKGVGLIMGGLIIAINLFMILPLLSEFSEFQTFSTNSAQLLFFGLALIIFNIFAGGVMMYKYRPKSDKPNLLPS